MIVLAVGDILTEVEFGIPGQLSPEQTAVIDLPTSIVSKLNNLTDVGIFVGFYETATLFPINNTDNSTRYGQVCSSVFAATVGQNLKLEDLEDCVTIAFRLVNKINVVKELCYFNACSCLLDQFKCIVPCIALLSYVNMAL